MTNLSRSWSPAPVVLFLTLILAAASPAQAQSINQKKTSARAIIAGSHGTYDGTFASTGTSSICGEIPKEVMGVATFAVEFPTDEAENAQIQSIAFGSKELVGKTTTAAVFRLNVSVLAANGGRPYAYALNTDGSDPNSSGTATLTKDKGALTVKVSGKNGMGETIDLTIVCM